jgi:hypothetical protein
MITTKGEFVGAHPSPWGSLRNVTTVSTWCAVQNPVANVSVPHPPQGNWVLRGICALSLENWGTLVELVRDSHGYLVTIWSEPNEVPTTVTKVRSSSGRDRSS